MTAKIKLGQNGPMVHPIGMGGMSFEGYYGAAEESESLKTIQQALELGMMIDTADAYGGGSNETLIGKALKNHEGSAVVASKFGIVFEKGQEWSPLPTGWKFDVRINGKPEYAARCLDKSLERLGVEAIDLWYLHYPDPSMPIEETVGAMAEAVAAGKVKQLGLSNVTADELRRASDVHPIAAVQFEYSIWRREAELELLPLARELGATLVAWSPLGTGILTGTLESLDKGDFRNNNPRLRGEQLGANRDRFAPLSQVASELDITPAQLALAWLANQENVLPIPGTRRVERVRENAKAADISLSKDVLQRIDEIAPRGLLSGDTLVP